MNTFKSACEYACTFVMVIVIASLVTAALIAYAIFFLWALTQALSGDLRFATLAVFLMLFPLFLLGYPGRGHH